MELAWHRMRSPSMMYHWPMLFVVAVGKCASIGRPLDSETFAQKHRDPASFCAFWIRTRIRADFETQDSPDSWPLLHWDGGSLDKYRELVETMDEGIGVVFLSNSDNFESVARELVAAALGGEQSPFD